MSGYRILMVTTDDGEELDEKLIQPYLKEKLIAIVSATKPTDAFVESCNEKKIQVIAYNRNWKIPTTSSVACDHRNGGEIIAQGKPEDICKIDKSYTGKFLKNFLNSKYKKTA